MFSLIESDSLGYLENPSLSLSIKTNEERKGEREREREKTREREKRQEREEEREREVKGEKFLRETERDKQKEG